MSASAISLRVVRFTPANSGLAARKSAFLQAWCGVQDAMRLMVKAKTQMMSYRGAKTMRGCTQSPVFVRTGTRLLNPVRTVEQLLVDGALPDAIE